MEEVYKAEDDWDEDEATQYMIEQSLLDYSKHADSTARYSWTHNVHWFQVKLRVIMITHFVLTSLSDLLDCIDHEEVFTAIQAGKESFRQYSAWSYISYQEKKYLFSPGNEDALKILVQRKEVLSNADSRGWIPLHEAAVQPKKSILEITYAGPGNVFCFIYRI